MWLKKGLVHEPAQRVKKGTTSCCRPRVPRCARAGDVGREDADHGAAVTLRRTRATRASGDGQHEQPDRLLRSHLDPDPGRGRIESGPQVQRLVPLRKCMLSSVLRVSNRLFAFSLLPFGGVSHSTAAAFTAPDLVVWGFQSAVGF